MMEIEKRLAVTDLSQLKDLSTERLAKAILKYRNFKTKIALEKFGDTGYSLKSSVMLFNKAICYLKGKDVSGMPKELKRLVDEYKFKIPALTPTAEEKRLDYADRKKRKPIPVDCTPEFAKKQVTKKFVYGIRINDELYYFDTDKLREVFVNGAKAALQGDHSKVTITTCDLVIENEESFDI